MNVGLHPSLISVIDALHSQVAVLDHSGVILAVNRRWTRSGLRNGSMADCIGLNYLETCTKAAQKGDPYGKRAARGVRRALDRDVDHFGLVYRWRDRVLRLRTRRLEDGPARLMVAHEDITALLAARRARDAVNGRLDMVREAHMALVAEVYEAMGQRLVAIGLASHALDRAGADPDAVAVIRLAVDEAKHEMRRLRSTPICERGAAP